MDMLDWKAEDFSRQDLATKDGPPFLPKDPTSRRQLLLDLIARHANGRSLALSEILLQVETGDCDVNLQSASLLELREAFRPRPRLNPAFVCWLMGLPPAWTNIEHTSFGAEEMALYRFRLRAQLSRCLAGSESRDKAA